MKTVYFVHSSAFDYEKELYNVVRKGIQAAGVKFIFPYENRDTPVNSKEVIKHCNCLIAEVSFPSIGLGIEIGWANMLEIPIMCIYKEKSKVSRSLSLIADQISEYSDEGSLIKVIKEALNKCKISI